MQSNIFFLDQKIIPSSQYIFDDIYKTEKEKKLFSHNRKFTYFNQLVKMKHKLEPTLQIYNELFEPNKTQNQTMNHTFTNLSFNRTSPIFHNQKINHIGFKNHQKTSNRTYHNSMPPIQDISFDNNQSKNLDKSQRDYRPKLDEIMAQYRRMNRVNKINSDLKSKGLKKLSQPQKILKFYQRRVFGKSLNQKAK